MHPNVQKSLVMVGDRHLYQHLLIGYLFLLAAVANFLLFGPTFIFMNPIFKCTFDDNAVDQAIACAHLDECNIENDFTIVSQLGLYCDGQIDRNTIQSIMSVGSTAGLFVINYMSDQKGRKLSLLLSLFVGILGIACTILGGYLKSVPVLVVSQFICGFSGYTLIIQCYVIPSDFCEQVLKERAIVIVNYAWSLTIMLFGLLYFYYNLWYNYLILVALIPMIGVFLLALFFVLESPNFLYLNNRKAECAANLKLISIYNKRDIDLKTIEDSLEHNPSHNHNSSEAVIDNQLSGQPTEPQQPPVTICGILRQWQYSKMILIFTLAQIGANIYYYGSNYALDDMGMDYGHNMLLTGAVELSAFVFLSILVQRVSKKKGVIFFYLLAAVLSMLFTINAVADTIPLSMSLLGIVRFSSTIPYTIITIMIACSFPTHVQASCIGIVEALSQVGSFVAPIVVTMSIDWQVCPMIMLAVCLFAFAIAPMLFLKDTEKVQQQELEVGLIDDKDSGKIQ